MPAPVLMLGVLMRVVMLVVSCRFRRNRGVHADIVALSVVDGR